MPQSRKLKRALLFARDPGGANAVAPLAVELRSRNWEVRFFAKSPALERLRSNGLRVRSLTKSSLHGLRGFLRREAPDVVLTGTSADDFTERIIWKAAESLGIPSFAVLDQWLNYGMRFSRHTVSSLSIYERRREHPYLPTRIIVPDRLAAREAAAEGLPRKLLVPAGQPHYDHFRELAAAVPRAAVLAVRAGLGMRNGDKLVIFASEPMRDTYGKEAIHYWGYNEITIFEQISGLLERFSARTGLRVKLLVKQHPKESESNYEGALHCHAGDFSADIGGRGAGPELILASDLVCGMSSMYLLEAAALGRPILSVQIGLKRENPFVLHRTGISKSVLTRRGLGRAFDRILKSTARPPRLVFADSGAAGRIADEIERLLCRN